MKRVALILWQPSLPADAVSRVEAVARHAREQGQALHVYVLSPDLADGARYRHASVEVVAGRGWRRAWNIARLLQGLLVRYDLACFAGLGPAFACLCRGYRLQLRVPAVAGWSLVALPAPLALLRGRWFPAVRTGAELAGLLDKAAATYNELVQEETVS